MRGVQSVLYEVENTGSTSPSRNMTRDVKGFGPLHNQMIKTHYIKVDTKEIVY